MAGEDLTLYITIRKLKEKQSVRTTFKLPGKTVKLLADVAALLGVKQKSLLDELLEDENTFKQIAASGEARERSKDRRQKTYVVSRNSHEPPNRVACKAKMNRDYLVEVSILRPCANNSC